MRGYPTFAEAPEHALEAARDDERRSGDRFVYLPASAAPFVFVYSRAPLATRTADAILDRVEREHGPYAQAAAAVAEPEPERLRLHVKPVAPPAPAHRLTPEQEDAMNQMIALGANLRPDFTAPELRRAFRRLARQYHPDRHPDINADGKTHLSQIFAELAEDYRCLMALFER